MRLLFLTCLCGTLLLILGVDGAYAADLAAVEAFEAPSGVSSDEAWHIVADEIHYDAIREHYRATGQVVATRLNRVLQADYARFEAREMQIYAEGNIMLQAGEDVLLAQKLQFDLNTETGVLDDGAVFLKENHFHIKGDRIHKTGPQTWQVQQACFTTCDGPQPAWKITGRNLNVTIEGYGTVRNVVFHVKDVPLFYFPLMFFPAKTERQSGLLAPEAAWSSRNGMEYTQPLYWAISDQADATFYWHYLAKRGHKTGLEYRYVPTAHTAGVAMLDYLHDRQVDDGTPDSQRWGYAHNSLLRNNRDRWWLRLKHDQGLPLDVSARLDLDLVSDQDYLHEFRDGFTGYARTNETFYNTFGRDLDDYAQTRRANRLTVSRWQTASSLNAQILWYDDVVARRNHEDDDTLQRLPVVRLHTLPVSLQSTPLYYNIDSRFAHFHRETGLTGQRLSVYPRLYLPLTWQERVTLQPALGWRGSAWQTHGNRDTADNRDFSSTRGQFDLELDLASEFFRVFTLEGRNLEALKHVVRPSVTYRYNSRAERDDYPVFDYEDIWEARDRITYALTNTLIGRHQPDRHQKPYREIMRLYLEQSYNVADPDETDPHAFSDIYAQLRLSPLPWVALQSDAEWSPHDTEFINRNLMAALHDPRGNRLYAEHRYARSRSETLRTGIYFNLNPALALLADYETNLKTDQRIQTDLGMIYRHQCWSIDLRYRDEINEQKYVVMFNLRGLGGIGGQVGAGGF